MPPVAQLEDRRLREQIAQEWFDFEVPHKTWFTLPEVAKHTGMKETFVRELIEHGGLDAHAHNSRIIDSREDFRRHYRIQRPAIISYLLRTRCTAPADTLQRILSILDHLGPVSLALVAEHTAKLRAKRAAA